MDLTAASGVSSPRGCGARFVLERCSRMPFAMPSRHQTNRKAARGFTLAELMAVVVIVGILAALAIVGFRRYLLAAKSGEALQMIGAIRAAEESYRAEALVYMNVSNDLSLLFPMTTPTDKKWGWGGDANGLGANWRVLNVNPDGPVIYGYAVVAGGPGSVTATGIGLTNPFPATANEPWYIVQATGDVDNNTVTSVFVSSSFSSEIFRLREDE